MSNNAIDTGAPARLRSLAERVGGSVRQAPGDVAILVIDARREVCNEDGTFDLWIDGVPSVHSLTEDQMVDRLNVGQRAETAAEFAALTPRESVERIRDILRGGWGSYGPLPGFAPGTAYGHRPIPVDDLTDEQVIEIAKRIANQSEAA